MSDYTRAMTTGLLLGNPSHRVFYHHGKDKYYLVDYSGKCPESCDDGPLAVIMNNPSVWVAKDSYAVAVDCERLGTMGEVVVNKDLAEHFRQWHDKPIDYSNLK